MSDTSAVQEAFQEEEDDDGMETADHDENGFTLEPTLPVENMDSVPAEPVGDADAWKNEIPVSEQWEGNPGEVRKVREGAESKAAGVFQLNKIVQFIRL